MLSRNVYLGTDIDPVDEAVEAGDRFNATDALGQPVTLWPSDHAGLVASFGPAGNS